MPLAAPASAFRLIRAAVGLRLSHWAGTCATLVAAGCCGFASPLVAADAPVVLNVRDFGAIGDGTIHPVAEWIKAGRYQNLKELQRACPAIGTTDWSVDEAAFELAKAKLPAAGGTLYFPAGDYVAGHGSWTIRRDHVRLLGDGAERTILRTGAKVNDALTLSPYRHAGWHDRAGEQFPFRADSGGLGQDGVQLREAAWRSQFQPGDLVFIRNGACRFDQDYGEFNEVTSCDERGFLRFRHPLARDYTLAQINWSGTVNTGFAVPEVDRTVKIRLSEESGNFRPNVGETVTVGDALFEVTESGPGTIRLLNPGRGNPAANTLIDPGTRIAKSRAIIKVAQSTRDFSAAKIQFVGRRKVLNLSNSYGIEFADCRFLRDPGADPSVRGGLTIDGDGGRWARFTRCTLEARPPWSMQFARSFGGITFDSCTFTDATVAFTEFSFDCAVTHCDFDFHGPTPEALITLGKSGGDYRVTDNHIRASNAAVIFDDRLDIQSQRHGGEGAVVIHNNTITTRGQTEVFRLNPQRSADVRDNPVTAAP